jgi:hypothetical protein
MSSGHASHKGTSNKPNVNANDRINSDVEDLDFQPEEGSPRNELKREGSEIPAATERPSDSPEEATEEA